MNGEAAIFFGIPVFVFLPGTRDDDIAGVLVGSVKSAVPMHCMCERVLLDPFGFRTSRHRDGIYTEKRRSA